MQRINKRVVTPFRTGAEIWNEESDKITSGVGNLESTRVSSNGMCLKVCNKC